MPAKTRPPVTDHEKSLLRNLPPAVAATETFFVKGTIPAVREANPTLFYRDSNSPSTVKALPLVDTPVTALEELYSDSQPSDFGQGRETVHDEAYRLARELPADRIGLNVDLVSHQTKIMASISAFCKTGVEHKLYKLNCYTTGGLFRAHVDTPKAENHLGTLLVGIPAPFSGGELVLRHDDSTVTIDWSTEGRKGDKSFPWTFFYSDIEHEILPVTSGHRLTISYDVYSTDEVAYAVDPLEPLYDVIGSGLYTLLRTMLDDQMFLPRGGRLAFGLSHDYPICTMRAGRLAAQLKGECDANATCQSVLIQKLVPLGSDSTLRTALRSLGLEWNIIAVHEPLSIEFAPFGTMVQEVRAERRKLLEDLEANEIEDIEYFTSDTEEYEEKLGRPYVDRFSCLRVRNMRPGRSPHYRWNIVLTRSDFGSVQGEGGCGFGEQDHLHILREAGARPEWDLIWIGLPKSFKRAENIMTYGNQAMTEYTYMAAAIVVTFPPLTDPLRSGTLESNAPASYYFLMIALEQIRTLFCARALLPWGVW